MRNPHNSLEDQKNRSDHHRPGSSVFFAILARSPPIRPPPTIYTQARAFGVYYIYILNRPPCWRSPQKRPDTTKRPPIQTAAPPVFHTQRLVKENCQNMTPLL